MLLFFARKKSKKEKQERKARKISNKGKECIMLEIT